MDHANAASDAAVSFVQIGFNDGFIPNQSDFEIAVSIACFDDTRTDGRSAVIAAHGVYGNDHDYPSFPRTAEIVLSSPLDRARTIKRPT